MINVDRVLASAKEKYSNYVSYVARNPALSKNLSGESKAVIEAIVEAINGTQETKE